MPDLWPISCCTPVLLKVQFHLFGVWTENAAASRKRKRWNSPLNSREMVMRIFLMLYFKVKKMDIFLMADSFEVRESVWRN